MQHVSKLAELRHVPTSHELLKGSHAASGVRGPSRVREALVHRLHEPLVLSDRAALQERAVGLDVDHAEGRSPGGSDLLSNPPCEAAARGRVRAVIQGMDVALAWVQRSRHLNVDGSQRVAEVRRWQLGGNPTQLVGGAATRGRGGRCSSIHGVLGLRQESRRQAQGERILRLSDRVEPTMHVVVPEASLLPRSACRREERDVGASHGLADERGHGLHLGDVEVVSREDVRLLRPFAHLPQQGLRPLAHLPRRTRTQR
mmetsp:Transcript_49254/g.141601  ORF Transcript_49254/g.141601 Transcript_49254/m.141601 type:complete len:258 (-) Transcript_49254:165-938(-)